MSDATSRLRTEISRLSVKDRAELARFLIDSLDEATDPNAEPAWEEELARRYAEIVSGSASGEPAETVIDKLREKYS